MKSHHEFVILGAGPAGLQLGYFLMKYSADFVILDRAEKAGSFFQEYPRHRALLSINKVHTGVSDPETNMRWDWNSLICDNPDLTVPNYTRSYFPDREDLGRYLVDFAEYYDLPISYNTTIVNISRDDAGFHLKSDGGDEVTCKCLVMATGMPMENLPKIKGIELCETYGTHPLEKSEYENKRVLIIGKGNSGFETADHLINSASVIHMVSPEPVQLAWENHFVGSLRAVNNNFLDTYQLKSQNAVIDGSVDQVSKSDGGYEVQISYSHANGQTTTRHYDKVIACTGFRFDATIFDESCRPELVIKSRFPAQTTGWESTNVPDLFVAGTLMQSCDYRKTQSAFIHGFRNNVRTLSTILAERYLDKPWPFTAFQATPDGLVDAIQERLRCGAGIFQQPGFLAEVFVVDHETGQGRHYLEIRLDHVPNSALGDEDDYYVVTLEYGHHQGSPFSVERDPDPEMGKAAFYLHPVVRHYNQGSLVSEYHINDDLENEWFRPEYTEPLREFVRAQFEQAHKMAASVD